METIARPLLCHFSVLLCLLTWFRDLSLGNRRVSSQRMQKRERIDWYRMKWLFETARADLVHRGDING